MATYSVFIDTDDSYRHELAFFTTRAIQADEELTFDYGGFKGGHGGSDVQSFEACVCGSSKCRGRLPLAI
jgi:SET domain-containing protein